MNNTTVTVFSGEHVSLLRAGVYINNYYLWLIFALGFPGNCASVVTIIRMQKVTTSTFYVAFLAIADNLAIVQKLLYHQLTLYQVMIGPYGCKILNFLNLFPATYSNWILVFMAVERFVAVKFPLKIMIIWSLRRAWLSVVVLGFIMIGVYCHLFWTNSDLHGVSCGIYSQYIHLWHVWYWFNAAIYSIAPCVLLLSLNALIIREIKLSRKQRIKMSLEAETKQPSMVRQDRQITVMLMTVTFVFVVLTVPRSIFAVVDLFWEVELNSYRDAQKYLLDQLTFFLCDANHAINFYLYFITGRQFRRQFLDLCLCRKKKHSGSRNNSSTSQTTLHTPKLPGRKTKSGNKTYVAVNM